MRFYAVVLLNALLTACATTPTPIPSSGAFIPRVDDLDGEAATGAASPALIVDAEGAPVAAWLEGESLRVARYVDSRWQSLGVEAVAGDAGAAAPALALAPDGALLLAWRACCNPDGDLRAAIYDGTDWSPLGGPLDAFRADLDQPTPAIIGTAAGPVVAWRERDPRSNQHRLMIRRWDGVAWSPLGASDALVADPTRAVQEIALDQTADGAPVVAWAEWDGFGGRGLHMHRWDGETWAALPDPVGTSADDHNALGLEAAADGALYLAVDTADAGPLIARLRSDRWEPLPFPVALERDAFSCIAAPKLAAAGAGVVMLWADSCAARLYLSAWDGAGWSPPHDLGVTGHYGFDAYALTDGPADVLYLAWLHGESRALRAARVTLINGG